MTTKKSIMIDGEKYILESEIKKVDIVDKDYVIVRTHSAGVFAGYIQSKAGREVIMNNVRRLWYWEGAASLSQLAEEGAKNPGKCKFSMPVTEELLLEAIEILSVTPKAKKSIASVPEWKND